LRERDAFRGFGSAEWLQHFGHIGKRVPDDAGGFRYTVSPLAYPLGISDHPVQIAVLHPRGQPLASQASGYRIRSLRMRLRSLQEGETVFDTVIGGQCPVDQARQ
jgi:hypothetical protein